MMYPLLINIGSILAVAVYVFLCWKKSKSSVKTIVTTILGITLLVWGYYLSNFLRGVNAGSVHSTSDVFLENQGGHFIGRVLFVMWLFPPIYAVAFQKEKGEWVQYLDMLCVSLTVQHIFNRLACLCHGCCYGRKYSGPFAFTYPLGNGWGAGYDYSIYPTQLFEIIGMLILLVILLWRLRQNKHTVLLFEIVFAVIIFLSELMMSRTGVTLYFYLTAVQYAAIALILTALIFALIQKFKWI